MGRNREWSNILNTDVLITVGSRFLMLFLGFANSIIYARYLGPEGRGVIFLVLTVATMIVQFGNLGLHASNTFLVAQNKSLLGGLLANSFWVSITAGGVSCIAILVIRSVRFPVGVSTIYLWFAAAFAVPILFYMLGVNLLVGVKQMKAFNVFEIGNRLVNFLFILTGALLSFRTNGFLYLSLAANILVSMGLMFFLQHKYGNGFKFQPLIFGAGLRYAAKAYLTTLLSFLVLRGNVFLLKWFGGFMQLGYVSICFTLVDVMIIFPSSVSLVIFPNLVQKQADKWRITVKNTVFVGLLMLVACVILGFIAKPMIKVIFGAEFLPAVPILRWMLPGTLFLSMISILSQYLAACGFPKLLIGSWFLVLITVFVLGRLFIPGLMGVGMAIAFSTGYALLFILIFSLCWFTKMKPLSEDKEPGI